MYCLCPHKVMKHTVLPNVLLSLSLPVPPSLTISLSLSLSLSLPLPSPLSHSVFLPPPPSLPFSQEEIANHMYRVLLVGQ